LKGLAPKGGWGRFISAMEQMSGDIMKGTDSPKLEPKNKSKEVVKSPSPSPSTSSKHYIAKNTASTSNSPNFFKKSPSGPTPNTTVKQVDPSI